MSFTRALRQALVTKPNGNVEFSWINARLNGQNLLPEEVRIQERDDCVFQAFSAGADMAVRQDAASRGQACDVRFNASSLVRDYENRTGRKLEEECTADLKPDVRQETVASLFVEHGAQATSAHWEGEQRVKLTRCWKPRSPQFDAIANFIRQGKPVVGCFPADEEFWDLEPEEIYRYKTETKPGEKFRGCHYVLFVGYGYERGLFSDFSRQYLVFLNSGGTRFGDNGFGRVYFHQTFEDWFYVLKAKAPPVPESGTSTSPASTIPVAEPNEQDERPRQRRRLGNDGVGSTSSAGRQAP